MPRRHLGRIRGVLLTANVAASSLGPLIAGLTRDLHGSFTPALVLFVLLPLPLATLSLRIAPPRRDGAPAAS